MGENGFGMKHASMAYNTSQELTNTTFRIANPKTTNFCYESKREHHRYLCYGFYLSPSLYMKSTVYNAGSNCFSDMRQATYQFCFYGMNTFFTYFLMLSVKHGDNF
jgi:hypothetical protein